MVSRCDYIILPNCARYKVYVTSSDPYDDSRIKSYDQKLHRALIKIFNKYSLTSSQRKELICTSDNPTSQNSIFKLISKLEPGLGKLLLKRTKLSLLWIAVLSGYQYSAKLLVRSGADVNEFYGLPSWLSGLDKKSTVLHALLRMYPSAWNEQFIDMIINHGANLEARESNRSTVLHLAVKYGRVKVAKTLLEKGADVNAVRILGITPVLDAARTREVNELLPLLMSYGADINVKDDNGHNILRYLVCSDGDYVDLVRFFIKKGFSPREEVSNYNQSIHVAVHRENIELVSLFLDHGADVNARGCSGKSPLHVAARECDNPAMLLTLLNRGANISLKTIHGRTALHELAIHHSFWKNNECTVEKLKILLYFGADIFAETKGGSTILDIICREDLNNRAVRHLLKTMALKGTSLQLSTEFKGERIIEEKYPKLWELYQPCIEEINRAKSTKFIESCTLLELLTNCQCRVAALMRHRKFQKRFRQFDLSAFPVYFENLQEAFERAKRYYQSMMDQENLIDDVTSNSLPYNVVRKIAQYTLSCDMCEMQKFVQ